MHASKRSQDEALEGAAVSEERRDNSVLNIMLCDPVLFPWTTAEIARELGDEPDAVDAVSRLTEAGAAAPTR
jgi:hypothetical protein